ncbi:hypothetical protein [Spongiibacter sp.]|uniref:hypothetical protein n=1 Tax=Spongiibacter sp. TaxID=2024860 RepID=UPI0035613B3F
MQYQLSFSSTLKADRPALWRWITSIEGISWEMSPYLRMTFPRGVTALESIAVVPGRPLFRSWLWFLKVIPFDYSDFCLQRLDPAEGFTELSRMGSMRMWKHVRRIVPAENGYTLTDELTFEPRYAGWLANKVVSLFFTHRHRRLRQHFGMAE